jgi:hypothetical protein
LISVLSTNRLRAPGDRQFGIPTVKFFFLRLRVKKP